MMRRKQCKYLGKEQNRQRKRECIKALRQENFHPLRTARPIWLEHSESVVKDKIGEVGRGQIIMRHSEILEFYYM